MITNEQFFKLPKWAQQEINRLRNNMESLEKKVDTMCNDIPSNTQWGHHMSYKNLPLNSNVKFTLPSGDYIEANIVDDELRVYGRSTIVVMPRASNSIYLKGDKE